METKFKIVEGLINNCIENRQILRNHFYENTKKIQNKITKKVYYRAQNIFMFDWNKMSNKQFRFLLSIYLQTQ